MANFTSTLANFKAQVAEIANVSADNILVSIVNNVLELTIITKNQKFNHEAVILSFGDKVIAHEYDEQLNSRNNNMEYYLNVEIKA